MAIFFRYLLNDIIDVALNLSFSLNDNGGISLFVAIPCFLNSCCRLDLQEKCFTNVFIHYYHGHEFVII